jgi:molecular chaperone GrpE
MVSEKEASQSLAPKKPKPEAVTHKEDVEDLKKALEEERKKTEEYLVKLKYLQADFENFQRRTLNEMRAVSDSGVRRLMVELLTVIDELDCALEVGRKMNENKAMVEGVALVRQKLLNILQKEGLTRIEAVGQKLDPNKNEAVLRVKAEASREGTVLEEIRVGYMFKGQVIRPSLVKVAVSECKEE